MRITIAVPDNLVMKDGIVTNVDCSSLVADGIHVVQWYGDRGEIEYNLVNGEKKPNEWITDLTPFQSIIGGP